jgi:molybdopterin-guanine dinucleotide biosynthesis protein A
MEAGPIGVILAGGAGRRVGGAKATVNLCGRPLIAYPLAAVEQVLDEVVVLAKDTTTLPSLPRTAVWIEREPRQHPLVGLTEALALAGGRPVLVCAVDLPLITPDLVRRLASTSPEAGSAALASHEGEAQPLLGCYYPTALEALRAEPPNVSVRDAVARLAPTVVEVDDAELLLNVNTRADLQRAARLLSRRLPTSSASAE